MKLKDIKKSGYYKSKDGIKIYVTVDALGNREMNLLLLKDDFNEDRNIWEHCPDLIDIYQTCDIAK
jgi:hypothetical protein